MKKYLLYPFLVSIFFSCNNSDSINSQNYETLRADSILLANKKKDSIIFNNVHVKKTISIKDQRIKVLKTASFSKKLKIELDGDYYRYKISERNQSFITIRIELFSASKPTSSISNFFPTLRVFSMNQKGEVRPLGDLEFSLYRNNDLNTVYLEQIFDYKDRETFVCWIAVDVPTKDKILISVIEDKKGGDINADRIIGYLKYK